MDSDNSYLDLNDVEMFYKNDATNSNEEKKTEYLESAKPNPDLKEPPYYPTTVEAMVLINGIGEINAIEGFFYINIWVRNNWIDPRITPELAEKAEELQIWKPEIDLYNQTLEINVIPLPIIWKDGYCHYEKQYIAKVSHRMDLSKFPFDKTVLTLQFLGNEKFLHVGLLNYRITPIYNSIRCKMWGPDCDTDGPCSLNFDPTYDPYDNLYEWRLTKLKLSEEELRWSRSYHTLRVDLTMVRDPFYYLSKILLLLLFLGILGFGCFAWDPIEENIDRLNYSATMFLATSAFLYIAGSDLPKTPYFTKLDIYIYITFAVQCFCGFLTMIIGLYYRVFETDFEMLKFVDLYLGLACFALFLLFVLVNLLPPFFRSQLQLRKAPKIKKHLLIPAFPNDSKYGVVRTNRDVDKFVTYEEMGLKKI